MLHLSDNDAYSAGREGHLADGAGSAAWGSSRFMSRCVRPGLRTGRGAPNVRFEDPPAASRTSRFAVRSRIRTPSSLLAGVVAATILSMISVIPLLFLGYKVFGVKPGEEEAAVH